MAGLVNPFLRGQYAAQAANTQADQAQLTGLATLLKLKQAQEEQPVRMDLLRAQTANQQAMPEDRAAARTQTKELTLARIGEQARRTDMEYDMKIRSATDKNEAEQWKRARDQARLMANEAALRMTGERLYYDTGVRVDVPSLGVPSIPVAAPRQPQGLEALLQNRPPAEQAAISAVAGANGAPMRVDVGPYQAPGAAPAAPVAPVNWAPAPAPVAMPTSAPDTTAALSMRQSGGLEGRFPQVGQAVPPVGNNGAAASPVPVPTAAPVPVPRETRIWTTADAPADLPPAAKVRWVQDRQNEQGRADAAASKLTAKVDLAGGRESQMLGRVITGGNQVAAALQNIVKLPIESSTGVFGSRGQSKGILNAGAETMVQKMTTQDVQTYNILTTGIQRSLAAIETSGLAPAGSLTHQMDAVLWKEGWSNFSKLLGLSETRQIVEKGMEVILANPRVDEKTKQLVQKIVDDVKTAVPWTNSDLIELQQKQRLNPNATLGDVIKAKGESSPMAFKDAEKERRYQEWKKANP